VLRCEVCGGVCAGHGTVQEMAAGDADDDATSFEDAICKLLICHRPHYGISSVALTVFRLDCPMIPIPLTCVRSHPIPGSPLLRRLPLALFTLHPCEGDSSYVPFALSPLALVP
jgi:hypothetical protein